jgi:hypothetical protein
MQVLIGVGKLLRLYDLGRKKLLRKCENKHIPHMVVDIKTIGERIIVSDVQVWATSCWSFKLLSRVLGIRDILCG